MLEVTALHLITPLFRATFMAILIVILLYIIKFFYEGYKYFKTKMLLALISAFLLIIVGASINLSLSLYGHYLIFVEELKVDGLSYHHIGNILYSIFLMCGFLFLIAFNMFSRWIGVSKPVSYLILLIGGIELLYNVEIAINAIVLFELIFILINVAVSSPTHAVVGRFMVIIGLLLLISSRVLMLFPFIPVTDMFSSMMEVAGFSGLIVLKQDVSLLVRAGEGELVEV